MGGKGYSSDDNRSMQLNDNNDRYYSSRGIDRDDDDYDYDEYGRPTLKKEEPKFLGYIPLDEWLPYFKNWVRNVKINPGEPYDQETEINGLKTYTYVEHFTGFNLWNEQHKKTWNYYKTRAMVDYCVENNKEWDVRNGYVVQYKVENWADFRFEAGNILFINRLLYKNNGLEFPENANEMFLVQERSDVLAQ